MREGRCVSSLAFEGFKLGGLGRGARDWLVLVMFLRLERYSVGMDITQSTEVTLLRMQSLDFWYSNTYTGLFS